MNKRQVIIFSSALAIVLFLFIGYSLSGIIDKPSVFHTEMNENLIYTDIRKEYNIVLDSFQIFEDKIRWNENLASLLEKYDVQDDIIEKATYRSSKIFDVRKIKAGNKFKIFASKDSAAFAHYFVYEHSPIEFLKIHLTEEPAVEIFRKTIEIVRKQSTGIVSSSLWNTMIDSEIDPMMAIRLSEIYAWTIDFFGLEEGDKFRVLYDEQFVDSLPIGLGQIYAVNFIHKNEEHNAYGFMQDSMYSFFDEEGKSLRRQFLKAPLRFSRISSGYSNRRLHPILKIYRPHRGVDYAAPQGTPVNSIGEGTVVGKGYTKAAGYYIKIRHNSVYTSGYMHLSRYGKGMRKGARVQQGQVIGYVGKTGYATGPHLDFRIWRNGHLVNPLSIKAPPVEPIKEENQERFEQKIQALMDELDLNFGE